MSAPSLTHPGRRTFLAHSLASAGLLTLSPGLVFSATTLVVPNVTGLYSVEVARIVVPLTAIDVALAVRGWDGKVAVGGGRYSMGGQVAIRGGLHLDMRRMRLLVWLRPDEKTVRVQAGMRWRDLQDVLDPLNLAVKTMQSYSNFTVGGAVSVNAHGRYVGHGPVANTVRALQLVLADGSVIETSIQQNADCFARPSGATAPSASLRRLNSTWSTTSASGETWPTFPLTDTRRFSSVRCWAMRPAFFTTPTCRRRYSIHLSASHGARPTRH